MNDAIHVKMNNDENQALLFETAPQTALHVLNSSFCLVRVATNRVIFDFISCSQKAFLRYETGVLSVHT